MSREHRGTQSYISESTAAPLPSYSCLAVEERPKEQRSHGWGSHLSPYLHRLAHSPPILHPFILSFWALSSSRSGDLRLQLSVKGITYHLPLLASMFVPHSHFQCHSKILHILLCTVQELAKSRLKYLQEIWSLMNKGPVSKYILF